MTKYEKYKNSGIEWIGEIPEHWESIRLKYIGYLYGGLAGKSSNHFNQESNLNNKPFIPFTNICNNKVVDPNQLQYVVIEEDEKQNQVANGDLFFMMSSENYDDVGKSSILLDDLGETYLNSFCKGFRITDENYYPPFINYLLLSKPYRSLLLVEANGYTRINLKIDKIYDIALKTPISIDEQIAIANYLDVKTEEIENLIKQKEELLILFEEEKIAIINQAVTKGINPDVKLKDSNIEWLGKIPEHWEKTRLRYIGFLYSGLNGKNSNHFNQEFNLNNKPFIPFKNIANNISINPNQLETVVIDEFEEQNRVQKGDLFFMMSSENYDDVGKSTILNDDLGETYLNSFCRGFRITNLDNFSPKFINYALLSKPYRSLLLVEANGYTRINLKIDKIKDMTLFVPVSINEQNSIVEFIESELSRINEKKENTIKTIGYLNEYKASLISEVVTGKFKIV